MVQEPVNVVFSCISKSVKTLAEYMGQRCMPPSVYFSFFFSPQTKAFLCIFYAVHNLAVGQRRHLSNECFCYRSIEADFFFDSFNFRGLRINLITTKFALQKRVYLLQSHKQNSRNIQIST